MKIKTIMLTCFAAILAGLSIFLLLQDRVFFALCAHMLQGTCGYFCVATGKSWHRSRLMDFACSFLVPCMGGFITGLVALGGSNNSRQGIAEMYQQHIDPDEYRDLFEYSGSDFKPDPQKLQPLGDILHSQADLSTKRTAIEALAQMECPESVAVLREALSLESVEVRFFAASVLGKLENQLAAQLKEFGENREIHSFTTFIELAQSYLDYAFFNMVEGKRRVHYLEKALECIEKAGDISLTPEVLAITGRVLLALERFYEARDCFDKYIKIQRESAVGLIWKAEACLGLRDFVSAADNCAQALHMGGVPEKMLPAVEYWAMGSTAS